MSIFQATLLVSYYSPIVLFSIGIPAALLNAIIFMGIKTLRQSPTSYYVVGQSLADMSALLVVFLQAVPSTSMLASSIACKLGLFFLQTTACLAMSFLCLAAFDRWASTSQSVRIRQLSSIRIARRLLPLPFLIWPLVNIPFFIYTDLIPPTYNCWFTSSLFEQIANYFLDPMLAVVFPLSILIAFGLLTCRNIRLVTHIRQQPNQTHMPMWEQQMTRMMLSQTLVSAICTLPRAIFIMDNIQFPKFENQSWPALVGKPVDEAVEEIKRENPNFNVLKVQDNSPVTLDFGFNRVRVFYNAHGKVSQTPHIG
ncbi:unnamed protein product [Rotaria sp. Silwood1]|nr:unnamed protein product [Rotaria sp. Silwood1]